MTSYIFPSECHCLDQFTWEGVVLMGKPYVMPLISCLFICCICIYIWPEQAQVLYLPLKSTHIFTQIYRTKTIYESSAINANSAKFVCYYELINMVLNNGNNILFMLHCKRSRFHWIECNSDKRTTLLAYSLYFSFLNLFDVSLILKDKKRDV